MRAPSPPACPEVPPPAEAAPRLSPPFAPAWGPYRRRQAARLGASEGRASPSAYHPRARRLRQSGRAFVLWGVLLYVLAQPALLAVLDWWHPTLYETTLRDKWRQLRQLAAAEPGRPLLVMFGSSRTEAALQAGRLSGEPGPGGRPWLAYNFGVPMAGPLRHHLHLQELLDAGVRPRLLLVEYLPPLLAAPQPNLTSEENWINGAWLRAPQLARLWPYLAEPRSTAGDWLAGRLAPAYGFRTPLQAILTEGNDVAWPTNRPHDAWGWRLSEPLTPEHVETVRAAAWRMYLESLARFRLGRGPCRAMRDLLELCRRERVPVVLVLTPESTLFRGWYSPAAQDGPRRLLENLRAAYHVPVLDGTAWLADEAFIDGHHVTPEGAAAFTARLLEELRQLPEWTE